MPHGKQVCYACWRTISSCRCINPAVTWVYCAECQAKDAARDQERPSEALEGPQEALEGLEGTGIPGGPRNGSQGLSEALESLFPSDGKEEVFLRGSLKWVADDDGYEELRVLVGEIRMFNTTITSTYRLPMATFRQADYASGVIKEVEDRIRLELVRGLKRHLNELDLG